MEWALSSAPNSGRLGQPAFLLPSGLFQFAPRTQVTLQVLVVNADPQRTKKLGVLVGETELLGVGCAAARTIQLLAVNQVFFVALVEADGDFQHQKQIIAGGADATHHLRNPFGVGKRFVDRLPQFLNQPLEVVVEVQKPPSFLWPCTTRTQSKALTTGCQDVGP